MIGHVSEDCVGGAVWAFARVRVEHALELVCTLGNGGLLEDELVNQDHGGKDEKGDIALLDINDSFREKGSRAGKTILQLLSLVLLFLGLHNHHQFVHCCLGKGATS